MKNCNIRKTFIKSIFNSVNRSDTADVANDSTLYNIYSKTKQLAKGEAHEKG